MHIHVKYSIPLNDYYLWHSVNWDDEDYNSGVTERGSAVRHVKGKGQVSRGNYRIK